MLIRIWGGHESVSVFKFNSESVLAQTHENNPKRPFRVEYGQSLTLCVELGVQTP